jgi:hypothetical protein
VGDDDALPPDPLTQLAQGAAQGHELFMAYVQAGFTRGEALQLLIVVISAGIAKGTAG